MHPLLPAPAGPRRTGAVAAASAGPAPADLLAALRRLLDGGRRDGQLVVEHQPIVALPSAAPIAVEALVRWDHPRWGRVAPLTFVPVAERMGLGCVLDEVVLHRALADVAAWDAVGAPVHRVAVNLGRSSLLRPDLARAVAAACTSAGVGADRLAVEVLEHDHLPLERVAPALHELAAGGTTVALDDFGSGCAGLSYLAALPAAVVKVDRGLLVAAAPQAPGADPAAVRRARALVTGIAALARGVGAEVTAEGVETAEQHDLAVAVGAQHAQGWRYGRSVPAARVPALFARCR